MALVVNDRVKETSTTTGTGTFDLAGAATGFQTFVAGVGDTNTTYYAIFNQGTTEWEVGLGTVTDAATDTLARTTLISSSTGSAVSFTSGTKDVFCTLPASKAVFGKQEGTNFTGSLLVGHSTSGTLNAAQYNVGVGLTALDALTSGDNNVAVGWNAGTAIDDGQGNVHIGRNSGLVNQGGEYNVSIGQSCMYFGNDCDQNVAIGNYALYGASGQDHNHNVAVGYQALQVLSTGDNNIGIGYQAGNNLTSGSGNVVIGNADVSSATGDDQLSISDNEDGSVVWMTGDSSGNVTFAGTATAAGSLLATQGDATALAVALG
jgi:hypothetical protein